MAKKPPEQPPTTQRYGTDPHPVGYDKVIANWTRVLASATLLVFIATGISAYFLYETDRTIKRQVEAAGLQLRAYINHNQLIYIARFKADPSKPDELPPGVNVGVTWKNFGSTPAREASYWISAKYFGEGLEPDFTKAAAVLSEQTSITFSPGTETPTAAVLIPLADVQKLNTLGGRAFLWGHISYRDFIPDSPVRHTQFCLVATKLPEGGVVTFIVYKSSCNYSN